MHIHVDTLRGYREALRELKVRRVNTERLEEERQIELEYSADVNEIKIIINERKIERLSHFLEDFHAGVLNATFTFARTHDLDAQEEGRKKKNPERQNESQKPKKKKMLAHYYLYHHQCQNQESDEATKAEA